MPSIVDALKIVHPEATGDTIADVLKSIHGQDTGDTIDELILNGEEGGGGEWTTDGIAAGTEPNGAIVSNESSLGRFAFAGKPITSFSGPNVTSMTYNCFGRCDNLVSVSFPALTYFAGFSVNNPDQGKLPLLTRLDIPNVTAVTAQAFTQMPSLTELILPKLTTCPANGFNTNDSGITTVDLGEDFTKFTSYSFNGSANVLVNVIIRNTQAVPTVENSSNVLPKRSMNYYVPSALIESYKVASNWSSYYNSGYCNFIALEGSPYESEDWYLND